MFVSKSDIWVCSQCGRNNHKDSSRCRNCNFEEGPPKSKTRGGGSGFQEDNLNQPLLNENTLPGQISMVIEDILPGEEKRKRQLFLLMISSAFVVWSYLVWEFHKWDASWGPVNVLLVALVAAAIIGWWVTRQTWYRMVDRPTRWRLILIPVAGFILCTSAGIYFTEPIEAGGSITRSDSGAAGTVVASSINPRSPNYQYNYHLSRASDFYIFSELLDFTDGVDDVDVDEGCFVFLLVVLVIMLILGSAIIPHFWILATFVLLVVMALITYREWRLVSRAEAAGPAQS